MLQAFSESGQWKRPDLLTLKLRYKELLTSGSWAEVVAGHGGCARQP